MTDLREAIRRAFDPTPAVGLEQIMAASRRSHRRHRRMATFAAGLSAFVAVLAVTAVVLRSNHVTKVTTGAAPQTAHGGTQPNPTPSTRTASVQLPRPGSFDQITTSSAGELLLGGVAANTSGGTTSPTCLTATVNPQTLAVSRPVSTPCTDPTSPSRKVGTVTRYHKGGPTGLKADITIATVTSTGQVTEGPVVMTYTDCSDCRPVSVYGDGLVWIYDNSTPRGAEIVEVSDTTGALIATISMPKLFRPLLAANQQGLYIANSLQSGQAPGEPPPSALYRLAPDAKAPAVVVADTSLLACWLTADPGHLWIGMGTHKHGCAQQTIWRLDGANPKPAFETPTHTYLPQPVGNLTSGLWTVIWPQNTSTSPVTATPELVHIDPSTGKVTVTATLPAIQVNTYSDGMQPSTGTLLHGYLYLLEPPVNKAGGYTTLLRIDTTPS